MSEYTPVTPDHLGKKVEFSNNQSRWFQQELALIMPERDNLGMAYIGTDAQGAYFFWRHARAAIEPKCRPATQADVGKVVQYMGQPCILEALFTPRFDDTARAVIDTNTGLKIVLHSEVSILLADDIKNRLSQELGAEVWVRGQSQFPEDDQEEPAPDPGPGWRLVDPKVDNPATTEAEMYRGNGKWGRMYSAGWNDEIWYRCLDTRPAPVPENRPAVEGHG